MQSQALPALSYYDDPEEGFSRFNVLTTVNPGVVNYKQVHRPRRSLVDDPQLDSVLHELFQVPPTQARWNHRDGVLSWRSFHGDNYAVASPNARKLLRSPPSVPVSNVYQVSMPQRVPTVTPSRPTHRVPAESISIHPLLTSNVDSWRQPVLAFDVSKSPYRARVLTRAQTYMSVPHEKKLITNLSTCTFDRCILSFDDGVFRKHVLDVANLDLDAFLWALYDYFQEPVSASEHKGLYGSRAQYDRAITAMTSRCSAASDSEREWAKGMKRVDCLGERTWFKTMEKMGESDWPDGGDIWFRVSFMARNW